MDGRGRPGRRTLKLDSPDAILDSLPGLDQEADYVVADGPGSNTEISRALLLRADMALVPCKASMLEVRSLAQATSVLRQAQEIRGGRPLATIVLSMVGKNYRLTRDMEEAAAALKLPRTRTPVILRQVYADAPGQGTVVWRMGTRARDAADEIRRLFREILPEAARARPRRHAAAATTPALEAAE
jgi:chromosome partitioning protein